MPPDLKSQFANLWNVGQRMIYTPPPTPNGVIIERKTYIT
jgi:hypothetical protein